MTLLVNRFAKPCNYQFMDDIAGVRIYGHATDADMSDDAKRFVASVHGTSEDDSASEVYMDTEDFTAASPQRILI